MSKFFSYERFGPPQVIALVLLLAFIGQCIAFISNVPLSEVEANYILRGVAVLKHIPAGSDQLHSPLVPVTSVLGVAPGLNKASELSVDQFYLDRHRWFVRMPFLIAGVLLAASLWYVARRLFGNQGGYLALGLYVFSPGMVARSSLVGPEILGAWGAFGVIFTAIATAHTLYAPREVIVWNWKRIVLLGISIALAVGAQWSLAITLVPALLFMWWAVPHRRGAALTILALACFVGLAALDIFFLGNPLNMFRSMAHANWLGFSSEIIRSQSLGRLLLIFFANGAPAIALTFVFALLGYIGWRRPRYFSTTAPLVVAALFLVLALVLTHAGAAMFLFYALPFMALFAAGVFVDLIDSKWQPLTVGLSYGAIVAQAVYSIAGLVRVFSGANPRS